MIPLLQTGGPGGPELLIILLITGIVTLLPLAISVLIYRDAKKRNSNYALVWALGAFFGSLVVWILYLIVRDEVGTGDSSTDF